MDLISVENLSYSINNRELLKDISFSGGSSMLLAILGSSGSGKSTLLMILAGYVSGYSGKVSYKYGGEDIAFVFQNCNLISEFDALHNIMLPLLLKGWKKEEARNKSIEVLSKIGIEELKDRLVGELSGGQQARINLARALVQDPKILFLDEPTGSLDQATAVDIMELLKSINKDRLIIMVTHQEDLALKYGSRILHLKEGKLEGDLSSINQALKPEVSTTIKRIDRRLVYQIAWLFIKGIPIRSFLSILFIALSLTAFFLTIDISKAGSESIRNLSNKIMNYNMVEIAESVAITTDGGLELLKKRTPKDLYLLKNQGLIEEELFSLESYIKPNQRLDNSDLSEYFNCFFEPIYTFNKELLVGRYPSSYNEVIVNKNYLKDGSFLESSYQDLRIDYNYDFYIDDIFMESRLVNFVSLNITFKVVGVSSESMSFNYPSVYYSYLHLSNYLRSIYLDKSSAARERPYSLIDRLLLAGPDDPVLSYKKLAVVEDPLIFRELLKEDYEVESRSLGIIDSTVGLLTNISMILRVFEVLIMVGAFLLEFLTIKTLYEEEKKKLALFYSFKIGRENFLRVFFGLASLFGLFSFLLTIVFENIGSFFLNRIFIKTLELRLIKVEVFSLATIFLALLSFSLSYFASYFPYRSLMKKNLALSLRED